MIEINGAEGEGGGQIIRTALSLSSLTGKPVRLFNIRAKRSKPGMRPQHLAGLELISSITQARTTGGSVGSTEIIFQPQTIAPGNYYNKIGTAGAVSLVFQTVCFPLSFTDGSSNITIIGGTHVPWSPDYHYLEHWLWYMKRIGFKYALQLHHAGYAPIGGGKISAKIEPVSTLKPIQIHERGPIEKILVRTISTNLPLQISEKITGFVRTALMNAGRIRIEHLDIHGEGQGIMLQILLQFENSQACFTSLGARKKPGKKVAEEAINQVLSFLSTEGVVDHHLADQLLLPLSLAGGTSSYTTNKITEHLRTNANVISRFLLNEIVIIGNLGEPGRVELFA